MSDLKSGFSTAAKAVVKGSGAVIKTAGINMKLASAESNLKSLYAEIGQMVYAAHLDGTHFNAAFSQKFNQITSTKEKVNELKQKLDEAKGLITCQNCKESSKSDSAFCSKCGTNFSGALPQLIDEPIENGSPALSGRICTICNTSNDATDRFCLSCGRMM